MTALGAEDPVEKHTLKTHVVVEVFDVQKGLHRAAGVGRDRGRAVGREGDLTSLADPIDPQEVGDTSAAGDVRLQDVHAPREIGELRKGPLVLARGDGEATWSAVAQEAQALAILRRDGFFEV